MNNTKKVGIGATGIIAAVIGMKIIATQFTGTVHVSNQEELYDAFRKAEVEPVTCIIVDVAEMDIDSTIKMNNKLASKGNTLIFDAQGCAFNITNNFYAKGDSVVFNRRPDLRYKILPRDSDMTTEQSYGGKYMLDNNVVMKNGSVFAQGKKRTIGISYCCAFGGGVENWFISGCTVGIETRLVLNGAIKQTRLTNSTYIGILATIGNWSGANYINSQSNCLRIEQVRSYIANDAFASFRVDRSACVVMEQNISEGGIPDYHLFFDGMGSPLIKDFTCNTLYVEAGWKKACVWAAPSGGISTFNNLWIQPKVVGKGVMIDGSGSRAGSQINVTNIPWFTGNMQFKCDSTTSSGRWRFDNLMVDWDTSSFWVNGKMPIQYYGNVLKGGRNTIAYNGSSLNFNKQKFSSTALNPKQ